MAYLELEFEKIKGFNKLDEGLQSLFIQIYKRHNAGIGTDYKEDYKPIKVTKVENKIKVNFKSGEWLYYYQNGTWG